MSRLVTISDDSTAKVWDALTGMELLTITARTMASSMGRSQPGWHGLPSHLGLSIEGWASIWDASTGQLLFTLPHQNAYMRSVSFSPDGRRIVTTGDDRTAKIWDAKDGIISTLYGHTR
jgi:WD40 repeat protein